VFAVTVMSINDTKYEVYKYTVSTAMHQKNAKIIKRGYSPPSCRLHVNV